MTLQQTRKWTRKRINAEESKSLTEQDSDRDFIELYCKWLGASSQLAKDAIANRKPLTYKPFANISIKL